VAKRKLLLADDSITIQKVVNLTFADEGIEVITVGDGDSAMEKMTETAPDLVLADVNMPGLNGYQVCEQIKQNDKFRHTPVILLVGSFEPFDEEEAKRVGADDFLTKPFQSIRQLVNKVTALLDSKSEGDASDAEVTANNSFADTLDMSETGDISAEAETERFGDTGMDDEMIQTNQINSFALDEAAKFETREVTETIGEYGKTQPLSAQDLKEFNFGASAETSETGQAFGTMNKQNFSQSDAEESEDKKSFSPSFLNSNDHDDDFLEVPFDEEDEWEDEEDTTETQIPAESAAEQTGSEEVSEEPEGSEVTNIEETAQISEEENKKPEISEERSNEEYEETKIAEEKIDEEYEEKPLDAETITEIESETENFREPDKTPQTADTPMQFPPELIDAIARRVIEQLSDKAVKEIAREVVPQQADLIIRKMVEEKLKE